MQKKVDDDREIPQIQRKGKKRACSKIYEVFWYFSVVLIMMIFSIKKKSYKSVIHLNCLAFLPAFATVLTNPLKLEKWVFMVANAESVSV